MKILITGVTGFVGGKIANRLIEKGYDVTGIGRKETLPLHIDKRCKYLQEDITGFISEKNVDIVIHAAAQVDDRASYNDHYNTNVIGTANVIKACKSVKLFLLISSSSVYSFTSCLPYKENEGGKEFDKLSHYGKTKFLAEQELLKAAGISHKIILRPRAIYGAGDSVLLPRLLNLVKKNYILLPIHTTEKISLTNIDNLVDTVDNLLVNTEYKSGTFNIADDKIYSLKEAIPLLIEAALNRKLKIFFIPKMWWILLVKINNIFHFIPQLTAFGSNQLTQTALLDIGLSKTEINYIPLKNFNESVNQIRKYGKITTNNTA